MSATTTTRPLEQLSALLPKTTNAELVELIVTAFEEGAARLENYADLLDEPDTPEEAIEAGIAFGYRLKEVQARTLSSNERVSRAALRTYHALRRLTGGDDA